MAHITPTGRQLSAARALVGLTQKTLCERAGISVPTLKRMEASDGVVSGYANNVHSVLRALESSGVVFIEENGGGVGVRLRDRQDPYSYIPFPVFQIDLPFGKGRFGVFRKETSYDRWASLTLVQMTRPPELPEGIEGVQEFWARVFDTEDVLQRTLEKALSVIEGPRKPASPSELTWNFLQPKNVYPSAQEYIAEWAIDWAVTPPKILHKKSKSNLFGLPPGSNSYYRLPMDIEWWRIDE